MKLEIMGVNDLRRHISPLHAELKQAAARVIDSAWYVLGREVEQFEQNFASYCGAAYCRGVANGTDALELALKALGVSAGETVATVANAGMYSTTAILSLGAVPAYVDVDAHTLLMDPVGLERVLAAGPVAALVVTHLYGRMADMTAIMKVANKASVPVIEDCAQAHGASLNGRKAGSFGAAGVFSFYPTKNLGALGDGGAIITQSEDVATKVSRLRQYGWTRRYHAEVSGGRNSRLDELQAAFLNVMLPRLDNWNARRRQIAALYSSTIKSPRVVLPTPAGNDDVVHLYVLRTEDREGLRSHLAKFKCPTDVHFPMPDYLQPAVHSVLRRKPALEVTEKACKQILTLPCFPELSDEEVAYISDRVTAW
jgi:aminotransferase EvaB